MEEDERRGEGQETIEESLARVRQQIVDTSERLRTRVEEMTAKHGRIIQTKREAESLLSQSPSFGSARRTNGEPPHLFHSEPNGSDVRSPPHRASFVSSSASPLSSSSARLLPLTNSGNDSNGSAKRDACRRGGGRGSALFSLSPRRGARDPGQTDGKGRGRAW